MKLNNAFSIALIILLVIF